MEHRVIALFFMKIKYIRNWIAESSYLSFIFTHFFPLLFYFFGWNWLWFWMSGNDFKLSKNLKIISNELAFCSGFLNLSGSVSGIFIWVFDNSFYERFLISWLCSSILLYSPNNPSFCLSYELELFNFWKLMSRLISLFF